MGQTEKRIEKTVFISYRRTNVYNALAVYQDLTQNGFDVFFDYESIRSGDFENLIFDNIRARAHFLVVLSPSALERCREPNDLMRREIETALDEKRNIVPLIMEGFDFDSPVVVKVLTGKLALLRRKNGLRVIPDYFSEAMDRLRKEYLRISVEDVHVHELSVETQGITEAKQTSVNKAAPVQEAQLTAEEWFEKGFVFQVANDLEEAYRCYSEAIRLDSKLSAAYYNVGYMFNELKRYEEAEAAYRKAIELDPSDADAYTNLGNLLRHLKRYDEVETAYRKAIELNPSLAEAYTGLGLFFHEGLKHYEEAEIAYRKAIELNPLYAVAYYNFGNLLKVLKRYEEAEATYRKAIELNPSYLHAYNNLGTLLCDNLKRYSEAEAAFRRAIELDPSHTKARDNLASLLRLTNKKK